MDPSFSEYVLHPPKSPKLSIKERRELVWHLAKWPESAPQKLQSWSRRDLLEILCVEMGKERKYTGLTKQKLIENLFRIVSEKKSGKLADVLGLSQNIFLTEPQIPAKRQRKNDHPLRLPVELNIPSIIDQNKEPKNSRSCLNVACRALLSPEDLFCRRCSCCICRKYDDNKDPSLWLSCSSEDSNKGDFCGLSCHLDCALKDERTGIMKNGHRSKLDGSYYCFHCGRVNSLLGCWRKQLLIAKDARRVDVLCHRVSLSHKLLCSTHNYQNLHEIVDEAMMKLEAEVGEFRGPQNFGRGIVNRLSVGALVQRLCAQAIQTLDAMLSTALSTKVKFQQINLDPSEFIKFEDKSPSSLIIVLDCADDHASSEEIVGFMVWHRKADATSYPSEPTGILYKPNRRFLVTGLVPGIEYIFRVAAFSEGRELENWEVGVTTDELVNKQEAASPNIITSELSNHSSEAGESHNIGYVEEPGVIVSEKSSDQIYTSNETEADERPGLSGSGLDEEPNSTPRTDSHRDSNSIELSPQLDVPKSENASKSPLGNGTIIAPNSSVSLLLQYSLPKPDTEPGSSSKKRIAKYNDFCRKDGPMEGGFEYCVKVVRWLECKGFIESNFRVKFLTWFSLRATLQERRVVSVYVDTLIDDPRSLADQLVDTFSDTVCSKRLSPMRNGFCMRLWH